ncbi:MAG: 1-(5-phosphoribosyl)-5-[(5-phosphoribosylamino)methylideneamino]imidazole-4-carboxamide isomerase [Chloroflexaceae bacterium]|nr:1-(5-phosphoribosyl)-5-[(5-phosphoribosylamino)methylideneamino]imidazole-4-carboxamide isomerase [Chloroflexaceae bacterium]
MEIIPAIDIKDGVCVRLYQGDFEQATVYGEDPAAVARHWVAQGATRLHVVDLDGARTGYPTNTAAIRAIVAAVEIPVQLGGGMRTDDAIQAAFATGVERVIIGTAAVRDPGLVTRMVERYDERIIIGVDARDGWVATAGWTEMSEIHAAELIEQMAYVGVQRVIYTDIARDGTLTEPNYAATGALVRPDGTPPAIIASGGIAQVEHLLRLAALGVAAAIVGRALYTGDIQLPQAIAAVDKGVT